MARRQAKPTKPEGSQAAKPEPKPDPQPEPKAEPKEPQARDEHPEPPPEPPLEDVMIPTLLPGYEVRPAKPGRPVWDDITRTAAYRMVRAHHDHTGGPAALEGGREMRCGGEIVRRKRPRPSTARTGSGAPPS